MDDKLGKKLEVGQVCDIFISDILSAYVIQVEDGGLVDPSGRQSQALLVLNIAIPMRLNPGQRAPVYIVRETDKPKTQKSNDGERIM